MFKMKIKCNRVVSRYGVLCFNVVKSSQFYLVKDAYI